MTDEANDNSGLLASVAEDEEQTTESQEQSINPFENEPTAEDDEPLQRPDFWPEKFWTKDSNEPDLEGIAKSYSELEKAFRAGKHKPPENGEYSLDGLDGLSKDDPVVQAYTGWAAKYGLSQQAFTELAGQIMEMGGAQQEQTQQTIQQEMESLGPNARAILQNLRTWGLGLKSKGVLSDELFKEFEYMGGTAMGVRVLMKIRESQEGRIPIEMPPVEGAMSEEERASMVADPRYLTDPAFRNKVYKAYGVVE